MELARTGSLTTMAINLFWDTPVRLVVGDVRTIKGASTSSSLVVVNAHETSEANPLPARSLTPPASTLTVYTVFYGNGADGVKVTMLPFTLNVPVTDGEMLMLVLFTELLSIFSVNPMVNGGFVD